MFHFLGLSHVCLSISPLFFGEHFLFYLFNHFIGFLRCVSLPMVSDFFDFWVFNFHLIFPNLHLQSRFLFHDYSLHMYFLLIASSWMFQRDFKCHVAYFELTTFYSKSAFSPSSVFSIANDNLISCSNLILNSFILSPSVLKFIF